MIIKYEDFIGYFLPSFITLLIYNKTLSADGNSQVCLHDIHSHGRHPLCLRAEPFLSKRRPKCCPDQGTYFMSKYMTILSQNIN